MGQGDTLERSEQLTRRAKLFALRVIRLFRALPRRDDGRIMGRQILRSGTSIGANYRAACRSRTSKQFVAKLRIVVEEADETAYWLELLGESGVMKQKRLEGLMAEANELLAIFAASLHTAETHARSRHPMVR